jgi:acyl-coenzyme A synthetase/AMP-(fatty) acid ligase
MTLPAGPPPAPGEATSGRPIPRFLTDYTPTRATARIHRFSRLPAARRMSDLYHAAAEHNPTGQVIVDRPADIDPAGPTVRTYGEWAALVDQASAWLYAAGVRPWDRVAVIKKNHFDVALLSCSIARLGAIPALMSGAWGPEVAHTLLGRLERPFLVTDREHIERCGITPEAVAELTLRTISVDGTDGRADIADLAEFHGAPEVEATPRAFHEPQIITHTSGTTGIPKLVMHSAESVYSMGVVESDRWPFWLRREDTVVFCDPFCHERLSTFQLAMVTVTPRMVMLSDPTSPKVRELLEKYRPTVVEALPNIYLMWEPLTRDPAGLFAGVRLFVNSFDAIHTRTIRMFMAASKKRLPVWIQSWSQTENGVLVMRPYLRGMVRRRGHLPPPTQLLGVPIPMHSKIRAVDPATGEPLPHGKVGLIEISQPGRCLAYVAEQDRHDIKVNGEWWNTGDLGIINRLGAVRLVDREVDRIDGGTAVSAIALEDVLLDRLPETTEVIVLPNSDGLPVPVLSTEDDVPLDRAAWAKATRDLPELAAPIQIRWEEFPRTGTWKIRRLDLRKQVLSGAEGIGTGRWT